MAKPIIYIEPSEAVKQILSEDAFALRKFVEKPEPVREAILKFADEIQFPYFNTLLNDPNARNKEIGETQLNEAMNQAWTLADFFAASIDLFIDRRPDVKPFQRTRYLKGIIITTEEFKKLGGKSYDFLSDVEKSTFHLMQCQQFLDIQMRTHIDGFLDARLKEKGKGEAYYLPLHNRPSMVGIALVHTLSYDLFVKAYGKINKLPEDKIAEMLKKQRAFFIQAYVTGEEVFTLAEPSNSPIAAVRPEGSTPGMHILAALKSGPGKMN